MLGRGKEKERVVAGEWAASSADGVRDALRQSGDVLAAVQQNPGVLKSDRALADFLRTDAKTAAAMRGPLQNMLLEAHRLAGLWTVVQEGRRRVAEAARSAGVERLKAFLAGMNPQSSDQLEGAIRTFARQAGGFTESTRTIVNIASVPDAANAGTYTFDGITFAVEYQPGGTLTLYAKNEQFPQLGFSARLRFEEAR